VGGTAGENERLAPGGDGFQVGRRVRPVLLIRRLVGKPRRRRGSWGDLVVVSELRWFELPVDSLADLGVRCP
jgi:hypothetical protein